MGWGSFLERTTGIISCDFLGTGKFIIFIFGFMKFQLYLNISVVCMHGFESRCHTLMLSLFPSFFSELQHLRREKAHLFLQQCMPA